jgi:epoxyqueuosine reductase
MSVFDRSHLTVRIREEAARLGFFRTGIAPSGPLPRKDYFDRWIQAGMHGEMFYLEAQAARRRDPGLVLQNARSLIVLALNYHCGKALTEDPLKGKISRYAWGEDYHQIVKDRLHRLLDFIVRLVPGTHGLCYVDTGPIMEKAWGAQTALAWLGKHTNLITRELGSWFFIGVVLLDLELEYDSPEPDFCGTCTRCIEACPTRAIVAPYVVDARLCISYLTIELRGAIPGALRPLIGNRVFGCDDCQEVCPWNRFAVNTEEEGFSPRSDNLMPELASLVTLTQEEFSNRFHGSPIRRAKRNGFVRNVVVALGNSRRPEAVPALAIALRDTSPLVRAHAAWALGQIGTGDSRRLLEAALDLEAHAEVVAEITQALSHPGSTSPS